MLFCQIAQAKSLRENAVRIQIWTALIAMLLLKLLQFRSRIDCSQSNLIALLRWNLLTHKNLWKWIDDPFPPPPAKFIIKR